MTGEREGKNGPQVEGCLVLFAPCTFDVEQLSPPGCLRWTLIVLRPSHHWHVQREGLGGGDDGNGSEEMYVCVSSP